MCYRQAPKKVDRLNIGRLENAIDIVGTIGMVVTCWLGRVVGGWLRVMNGRRRYWWRFGERDEERGDGGRMVGVPCSAMCVKGAVPVAHDVDHPV